MSRFQHAFNIGAFLTFSLAVPSRAEIPDQAATKLLKQVSQKYAAAKRYAFEGTLDVARQIREDPQDVLAKATVKLEFAPGGKFLLHIKNENDKSEYSLISDGRKSWAYVPSFAKYTERDATTAANDVKLPDTQYLPAGDLPEGKADTAEQFARQIMPLLAGLEKNAQTSFLRGMVLQVVSKKDPKDTQDHQTLAYLNVNTSTLVIFHLTWIQHGLHKNEKALIRADFKFTDLRINDQVPDTDFSFSPPAGAELVESLQIPGRAGL